MPTNAANGLRVLCGNVDMINVDYCDIPFSSNVKAFCVSLSEALLGHSAIRDYPDLATFAFYCRKANVETLAHQLCITEDRMGWGKAMHIAPANIPVNFAYSFLFGLLAGNSNLVRLPSKTFPQISLFCEVVEKLFIDERFQAIAEHNVFVRFSKESSFLRENIHRFDALLIWGGDQTVSDIRALPRSPRCVEVAFADRYSFSVFDAHSINALTEMQLNTLCRHFYNDTFLVDQNACSSPSLMLWQGSSLAIENAKARFWPALQGYVLERHRGNAVQIMDKQILLLKYLEKHLLHCKVHDYGGLVMVATLQDAVDYNHRLKGMFGLFFELEGFPLEQFLALVNKKYQTLTYFGLDPDLIKKMLLSSRCKGIDRVVPVGSALDIGVLWDGYDLVRALSRVISVK